MDCFVIDVAGAESADPSALDARHAVLTYVTNDAGDGGWLLWHAPHPHASTRAEPYFIPGTRDELTYAVHSAREFLHAYFGLDHTV